MKASFVSGLCVLLSLFITVVSFPVYADPVEDALNEAKKALGQMESAAPSANPEAVDSDKGKSPTEQPQVAAENDEAENDAPEQALYPGVANCSFKFGGAGQPRVFIYYPAFGDEKVDPIFKEFAQRTGRAFEKSIQDALTPGEEAPQSYEQWEATGNYTLEKPCRDVVSVAFSVYTYTGGAHGDLQVTVLNYNLATGEKLTLQDLFADPSRALRIMSEVSAARLRASLGEDVEEDMLKEGTAPNEDNFSCLLLNPGGVAVEFQPYQVGPWSIGQQHVQVTLEELAPAGPSRKIWPEAHPATSSR